MWLGRLFGTVLAQIILLPGAYVVAWVARII